MSFFGRSAWVIAGVLVGACGGKVETPGTTGNSNGAAGDSSSSSSSSGNPFGTGSSNPGPGTAPDPAGGATGILSPDTPACEQICNRVAQAGCALKNCDKECNGAVIANSKCAPQFQDALKCFVTAPIDCTQNGAEFFGCDQFRDRVSQCVNQSISTPPNPGGPNIPPSKPIPPQCLGAAPIPPSGNVCSGGGAAGGTGGTGGNAAPTCESMCTDATGNVWSSYCVGSNCSCMYNGKTYCSCVSDSPCSSCCPGI
jgi:hypothetical protein